MKITGVERKQGEYEGTPYNNVIYHGTEPIEKDGLGLKVKSVKVKYAVLSELFNKQLTEKEIFAFVGKEVVFYYDEFKNVKFLQINDK